MTVEGKTYKFSNGRWGTCYLKVSKVKGIKKIYCSWINIRKKKKDGSLVVNLHSGINRRLYFSSGKLYSLSTNQELPEIPVSTFDSIYETLKSLKEISKKERV